MERCGIEDLEKVNRILRDKTIYPLISDDFSPDPEFFSIENVLLSESSHVLCPNENTAILFFQKNGVTWEIHYNVLKAGRGKEIRAITPEILNYAFTKIKNCKKLTCSIGEMHKNVIEFAVSMGMKPDGRIKGSLQKDGKLYDEIILGMRKIEWEQL